MKPREWQPVKKDYDFIRANRNIMSNSDLANYFGVRIAIINRELNEMGCRLDHHESPPELEAGRWLRRWEQAHLWGCNPKTC